MAGILIRMRWAALRHSLTGAGAAGVALVTVPGLLFSAWLVRLAATDHGDPGVTTGLLAPLFLLGLLTLLVGPLLPAGGDATLRPEHFALLPVSRRRLALGLAGADLVGPMPVVVLVGLGALVAFGLRLGGLATLVASVAVVLSLAVALLTGRTAAAVLRALQTSRRGAAVGWLLLIGLLTLPGVSARWIATDLGPSLLAGTAGTFSTVMRALPSGWGAVAVEAAGRGDVAVTLAGLGALASLAAALGGLWLVLVGRAPATARTRAPAAPRSGRAWLPATPVGAVVAKDLRGWARDPIRTVFLVAALAESFWLLLVPGLRSWIAFGWLGFLGMRLANEFGAAEDRRSRRTGRDNAEVWTTLVTPGAEVADVRGRQVALAAVAGPGAAVLTAVALVLGAEDPALGLAAGTVALGAVVGWSPLLSAYRPMRFGGEGGGSTLLTHLLLWPVLLGATVAAGAGPLWLAGRFDSAVLHATAVVWAPVSAVAFARVGGTVAVRRLVERGPELLQTVRRGPPRLVVEDAGAAEGDGAPPLPAKVRRLVLVASWVAWLPLAQGVGGLIHIGLGTDVRSWFLARYLPEPWPLPVALAFLAIGLTLIGAAGVALLRVRWARRLTAPSVPPDRSGGGGLGGGDVEQAADRPRQLGA